MPSVGNWKLRGNYWTTNETNKGESAGWRTNKSCLHVIRSVSIREVIRQPTDPRAIWTASAFCGLNFLSIYA